MPVPCPCNGQSATCYGFPCWDGKAPCKPGSSAVLTWHSSPIQCSLYVEEVDVGEEQPRTVVSGLVKFIPEAGKLVVLTWA